MIVLKTAQLDDSNWWSENTVSTSAEADAALDTLRKYTSAADGNDKFW